VNNGFNNSSNTPHITEIEFLRLIGMGTLSSISISRFKIAEDFRIRGMRNVALAKAIPGNCWRSSPVLGHSQPDLL
jgi:hypothetical protein